MNSRYIVGIVMILALGGAAYYFGYINGGASLVSDQATTTPSVPVTDSTREEQTESTAVIADVGYLCDGGKTVHAVYYDKKVIIELSDGRAAQLPQTISASGVRYANADESLVFWSKGPTAFVQEAGKIVYENCAELDTAGVEGL